MGTFKEIYKGSSNGSIRALEWVQGLEFPKIRGALFWAPYKKDPTIQGTILGSPVFRNSHIIEQNLI